MTATRITFVSLLAIGALLSGPAQAQVQSECNGSLGIGDLSLGRFHSNSTWQQLASDASNVTAIRIAVSGGSGAGHQLNLASNWSSQAVFDRINLPANGGTIPITSTNGPIIAFVSHPTGSPGLQVQATLCTGSITIGGGDTGGANTGGTNTGGTNTGGGTSTGGGTNTGGSNIVTAQQSGLPLSSAFETSRMDYWARHDGVRGTLSAACIELHDSFYTRGPDGKAYPTWHPPVATLDNGQACYFGHEHGDDPRPSEFYTDATYQQQRDDGFIPIPFGYANEVLSANGGDRHEDHFGHKIFRENFETAYGNSVSPASVQATGSVCTALLKLHQGTHSADALTNHLHESIAHISCTALPGSVSSRVHATALVQIGRPGWFSNTCGPYPVPGQTGGTRGSGESNAPVGDVIGNPPMSLGAPSAIVDVNALLPGEIQSRTDGERVIPGAGCVRTYQTADSPKANNYRFGHSMNDTWVRPFMITNAAGSDPMMWIKSYYSVFNPARVFYVEPGGAVSTRPTVEMCRMPPPGGPTTPSQLCETVLRDASINKYSIGSPYNGTIRNLNFKSLNISNQTGQTDIWTDPYGRAVTSRDPSRAIKQYVSLGYNGVAGAGADGTIARPDSVQVCRKSSGPYPLNLPKSDPCYWNGNDDLLFAKEWWRDFNNPSDRIHAPN